VGGGRGGEEGGRGGGGEGGSRASSWTRGARGGRWGRREGKDLGGVLHANIVDRKLVMDREGGSLPVISPPSPSFLVVPAEVGIAVEALPEFSACWEEGGTEGGRDGGREVNG